VECDEAWSFVQNKGNKRWIWLAQISPRSGKPRIVGCFIGDRSEAGARGLWESIPEAIRQKAQFYSDFRDAYTKVLPQERHEAVGKETGKTNHIERFNGTLRARCSRLVRQNYAFSKTDANHEGALWNFIHHYNASLLN
jgi:insertion element IS1 protein InsB